MPPSPPPPPEHDFTPQRGRSQPNWAPNHFSACVLLSLSGILFCPCRTPSEKNNSTCENGTGTGTESPSNLSGKKKKVKPLMRKE